MMKSWLTMATSTETAQRPKSAASSCCTAFYEQDWVRLLAEDSFHPGGTALTDRMIGAMCLPSDADLLDLGCGVGSTALMLTRDYDYRLTGVDASSANIGRAVERAGSAAVSFLVCDAHELPFDDCQFDGLLCECVFSLLTDKPAALAEMSRVLKAGGCVGLTDMAVCGALPDDLARVIAPWSCLADAFDETGYLALFEAAGFKVEGVANESAGLKSLLKNLRRKLVLLGAGSLMAGEFPVDVAAIKCWIDRFENEVDIGSIRYLRFQLRLAPRGKL
jgi:arsenite methyltransferase